MGTRVDFIIEKLEEPIKLEESKQKTPKVREILRLTGH